MEVLRGIRAKDLAREHEVALRAVVGGFHPGERHVITFASHAGISELFALANLSTAQQLTVRPDPSAWTLRGMHTGSVIQPGIKRLIEVLPHFEWQTFWKCFPDAGMIDKIEPYLEL